MRTFITTSALLASLAAAGISQAAPMSMLQAIPQAEQTESKPAGKFGWFSKWVGKESVESTTQTVVPPTNVEPKFPQLAYQAPTAMQSILRPTPTPGAAVQQQHQLPTLATAQAPPVQTPAVQMASSPVGSPVGGLPMGNSCQILREQGHQADRIGNLGEAERLYRLAISANPASTASLNDLALCLARQGQLEVAATMLRQAIQIRPEKPLYRNNIATVLVEMGQTDEAIAHLQATYPPATANYNLGHLLLKSNKTQEATLRFQEALAMDPSLTAARDMLATLSPQHVPQNGIAPLEQTVQQVAQAASTSVYAEQSIESQPTSATPNFPRLLPPVINR